MKKIKSKKINNNDNRFQVLRWQSYPDANLLHDTETGEWFNPFCPGYPVSDRPFEVHPKLSKESWREKFRNWVREKHRDFEYETVKGYY